MKKNILILVLFFLSTSWAWGGTKKLEPFPYKERFLMAITAFEDHRKEVNDKELCAEIADRLTQALFSYKRFRLVERIKLGTLIKEMNFQETDLFKNKVLSQVGNQLGAELILVGSILDLSKRNKKKSAGIASIEDLILSMKLEARIVRVDTGEILAISQWKGEEKSRKKRALFAKTDQAKSEDEMVGLLLNQGIPALAFDLAKEAPQKEA